MLEIIWMTCMEGLENVQAQVEEINIQLVEEYLDGLACIDQVHYQVIP